MHREEEGISRHMAGRAIGIVLLSMQQHFCLCNVSIRDWWAMGHQALAMEMEHLGKQWQLCSSYSAALVFRHCAPRVFGKFGASSVLELAGHMGQFHQYFRPPMRHDGLILLLTWCSRVSAVFLTRQARSNRPRENLLRTAIPPHAVQLYTSTAYGSREAKFGNRKGMPCPLQPELAS